MNALIHDGLAISERLKQAGLTEAAAKQVAIEIVSTVEDKAATKTDVREIVQEVVNDFRKEVHLSLENLRSDMARRMSYLIGAMALLLTALGLVLKLVP